MPVASKTLAAIAHAMEADQGAKFRALQRINLPLAEDAYREDEKPFRGHLGASLLGRECAREIWYGFHWVTRPHFEGRMLRLFNRGHLEEARFISLLQMIGATVWQHDENGKQFRIKGYKGHFGGSQDGVAQGIPDIPDEPCLVEFKTHNDKSFLKLAGKRVEDKASPWGHRWEGGEGVMKAKWEHFVQMQIYMGYWGLRWALYMAANKNDDDIYAELIAFDPGQYNRFLDRAASIIDAAEPPPRISNSPGWFKCKFCDHAPVCHGDRLPEINCRTCAASKVLEDGKWFCAATEQEIDEELQYKACSGYTLNTSIKAKV